MLVTDGTYYFRWKPSGLPSSYGSSACFLDAIRAGDKSVLGFQPVLPHVITEEIDKFAYQPASIDEVRSILLEQFSHTQELGLLNRLDTLTQGWLYFAPDLEKYQQYKQRQREQNIKKYYVAEVVGDCSRLFKKQYNHIETHGDSFVISTPLMHHRHRPDRMVAVLDIEKNKGRGVVHLPTTTSTIIKRTPNTTRLLLAITKGVRHQIRVHLSALGYPIVGDTLYGGSYSDNLHLWSIGMKLS